jgi:hypothetical protein
MEATSENVLTTLSSESETLTREVTINCTTLCGGKVRFQQQLTVESLRESDENVDTRDLWRGRTVATASSNSA